MGRHIVLMLPENVPSPFTCGYLLETLVRRSIRGGPIGALAIEEGTMDMKQIGYRAVVGAWLMLAVTGVGGAETDIPAGTLHIVDQEGTPMAACPLKHTDVEADISGFVARVHVRQTFHNPLDKKIEALYVFPLPLDAAVDGLVMTVGERRITGQIKPRAEARTIYEAARAAGHVASLLDQERPNIFSQALANIEPGAQVVIELSYVETLRSEDGVFEFVFPMVVGPRYMPGSPSGKWGSGWAPDTTQVPNASRISPPVALPGTRAGHNISLTVHLDAGLPLSELHSVLHEVDVAQTGAGRVTVALKNQAELPNRDFILRYRTATDAIGDAFLTHTDARGMFFTLVLQPPRAVRPEQVLPKELIFVIDRSGSMSGFPIEKAKEAMRLAIERMHPQDTFNLLSFSGGMGRSFAKPVPNTPANCAIALKYLADLSGSGGTEMMPAIKEALGGRHDPTRVRVVAFMTDGYVGNDLEIIDAVQKHAGTARVFAFGIGNAVNRFLLDGMAHAGRGAVEYVTLQSQADAAVKRFQERIHAPLLTDISIDWGTLSTAEVYPKFIPDLFSQQPIMLHGRMQSPVDGRIVLRGHTAAGPFTRQLRVQSPAEPVQHAALASLWARAKVKERLQQDYTALQHGTFPEAVQREITALGVEFQMVTQFTSLVAVEELRVTVGGEPITVAVPVDIPAGVSYEGVFGQTMAFASAQRHRSRGLNTAPIVVKSLARFGSSPASEGPMGQLRQELRDTPGEHDPATVVQTKLAEPLRGLDQQVAKAGKDGNLTVGKLRVIDHHVDVMVYLRDTSPQTLDTLNVLGLVQTGESKAARLLIGSIDVRRLAELAKLDAVIHVAPVVV
jgi:Ca-activated chloride channel family protein